MGSKALKLLLFCLLPCVFLLKVNSGIGQTISHSWEDYLEKLIETDEKEVDLDYLKELLIYYQDNPYNINDTSTYGEGLFPFISNKQFRALRAYIDQNGLLKSLEELYCVVGFGEQAVALLRSCVKTEETAIEEKRKRIIGKVKGRIESANSLCVEQKKGNQQEGAYHGSALKNSLRIQLQMGKDIQISLTGEKDAGEAFQFSKRAYGYDVYGFNIVLKNGKKIEYAVIGNYNLCFGQGLVLGTGAYFRNTETPSLSRTATGVKASSSSGESKLFKGGAIHYRLQKDYLLTVFLSSQKLDASLNDSSSFSNFSYAGYHRTDQEINNKKTIKETSFGTRLQLEKLYLIAGLQYYLSLWDKEIVPSTKLYDLYDVNGRTNQCVGIDYKLLYKELHFFGEIALSSRGGTALLSGCDFFSQDQFSGSLLLRKYNRAFHSFYGKAEGQTTQNSDEEGLSLNLRFLLSKGIQIDFNSDFYRYTWLKYQINAPATGLVQKISLSKLLKQEESIHITFNWRESQRNITDKNVYIAYTEKHQSYQLQAKYRYRLSTILAGESKITYTFLKRESQGKEEGVMLIQDVHIELKRLNSRLSLRYALFETESWESRLYSFERNPENSLSIPAYSGRGSRFYLSFDCKIGKVLQTKLRYGVWYYPEESSIGTSNEEIATNRKQEINACIIIHF